MKQKLLSILLASAMVMSVCACGNDAGNETPASKETASESVVASSEASEVVEEYVPTYPIVDEKITITALTVGEDVSEHATRALWDDVEKVTNIHIEWQNIDMDSFATYLASGDWPDLFCHSIAQTAMNDYGVEGGRFVNYLDYLDIMPNFKKTIEDYPQALAYATQINGEVYNLFRINGKTPLNTYTRTPG